MLIIGTDYINVIPDEFVMVEGCCTPDEFADELEKVFESWGLEISLVFYGVVENCIRNATTNKEVSRECRRWLKEYDDDKLDILDELIGKVFGCDNKS